MVSFREKWLTMEALCHAKFANHHYRFHALVLIMQTGYEVSSLQGVATPFLYVQGVALPLFYNGKG